MNSFLIVSDNHTKELKIISKNSLYEKNNVYVYEPIDSCETLVEAEKQKQYIETIGIQAFFNEIIQNKNRSVYNDD